MVAKESSRVEPLPGCLPVVLVLWVVVFLGVGCGVGEEVDLMGHMRYSEVGETLLEV
jgi:hypothetical protein